MSQLKIPVGPDDHVQGDDDAEYTLVEYGDYECPHCGRAYPIVKLLQRNFGRRLRFAFRNFPLTQLHRQAESAAESAEFAGSKGKFWEMHDLLFENQAQLGSALYKSLADALGLSAVELREALAAKKFQPRVRADFAGGVRSGVNGTPTFFINGQRYNGPWDFEDLRTAIDETSVRSHP
jgi:protein-disulfide isomerase